MSKIVNKRKVKSARVVDNTEKALAMRLEGHSLVQIGARLNLTAARISYMLTDKLAAMREHSDEMAKDIRTIELSRLDALFLAHWPLRKNVKSAQVLLNIMERRHKMLGLDAPTKTDLNVRTNAPTMLSGLDLSKLNDEELAQLENIIVKAGPASDPTVVASS